MDVGPEKRYDGERTANYEGGLGVRIKAECVGMWIVHHRYARNDQQIKTVNNEIFGHSFSKRIALGGGTIPQARFSPGKDGTTAATTNAKGAPAAYPIRSTG